MTLAAFMYCVCMILVWFLLYSRVILGYAFLFFYVSVLHLVVINNEHF